MRSSDDSYYPIISFVKKRVRKIPTTDKNIYNFIILRVYKIANHYKINLDEFGNSIN